jgi:hypothetical protein
VRLGKRDPDYNSPLVKVLLNKRNKFRRQGNRTDADKLASVIDKLIANNMRNRLRILALAPVNELWKALRLNSSTQGSNNRTRCLLAYNEQRISALQPTRLVGASLQPLFAYEIEPMLRKVRKTAPGIDNLPLYTQKKIPLI